mgnify:CR=1 FL=1
MGVQVDGKAGALLQSRHQLSRRIGGQKPCHVLDTQGISVDGCDDIIGSDAFFIYEEWLDDGEN